MSCMHDFCSLNWHTFFYASEVVAAKKDGVPTKLEQLIRSLRFGGQQCALVLDQPRPVCRPHVLQLSGWPLANI